MGDGGGLSYPDGLKFSLIDQKTGQAVFEDTVRLGKRARELENGQDNHIKANVYEMDFSAYKTPGMYRVSVEGIGSSLYETRPPKDGERAVGFGRLGFKTDQIVPNAWGGYMDAGDWDRRPIHIYVPRLLLDLYDLSPSTFDNMNLNLPESTNDLPDLLDEALWLVDFCKRTQLPEGGIRPGINSSEHPRRGEGSWQESLDVMAYPPTVPMSYDYAGVAAHAAYILEDTHPEKANDYFNSALRAFEWAENHPQSKGHGSSKNVSYLLAAAEFFRLTGDSKWQDMFLEGTRFTDPSATYDGHKRGSGGFDRQTEAGWVYYLTDRPGMNQEVKENFKRALLANADARIAAINETAFRWVGTKNEEQIAYSSSVIPYAVSLVRAHYVSQDEKYLSATILSCQMGAGANPLNVCYTSGVGVKTQQRMVHEDSYVSNQPLPPGLTTNGPYDPQNRLPGNWANRVNQFRQFIYPEATTWPALESWFDVGTFSPMCEFTVHRNIAPNAYVWGYLGSRQ
jgi:endoglucanase